MDKYIFIQTIQRYAGSFYRQLALAMQIADPINFQKIIDAFPNLISIYGPNSVMYQTVKRDIEEEREKDAMIFQSIASV